MSIQNHSYAIKAQGLTKHYCVYQSPFDRLKEVLTFNQKKYHREYTALNNINLKIEKGKTIGVLGPNGAGKSTLLKILAGIITPSGGGLEVNGKVSSIIELGTGFHPDFSGKENAKVNAAVLGFDDQEYEAVQKDIIEFAELGKYIDMPVKTYSSGMFARLAFSIAINARPDILLIDEALAVGDAIFTQRCIGRIRQLQEQGVTIFFVSHDTNTVRGLCDEVVLIDRGELIAEGDPKAVVQQYEVMVAERLADQSNQNLQVQGIGAVEHLDMSEKRFGTFEARIESVNIEDENRAVKQNFICGETVNFRIKVFFEKEIKNPVIGIMLRNKFGVEVFGTNTHIMKTDTGEFQAGQTAEFNFKIDLNLGNGTYQISYAIHTSENLNFDYRVDCDIIEVTGADSSIGIVPLDHRIEINKN